MDKILPFLFRAIVRGVFIVLATNNSVSKTRVQTESMLSVKSLTQKMDTIYTVNLIEGSRCFETEVSLRSLTWTQIEDGFDSNPALNSLLGYGHMDKSTARRK